MGFDHCIIWAADRTVYSTLVALAGVVQRDSLIYCRIERNTLMTTANVHIFCTAKFSGNRTPGDILRQVDLYT